MRQYASELEATAPQPFDDHWERKLTSVQQVKGKNFIYFFVGLLELEFIVFKV